MFKYWVLENITNNLYQEFVVNLLKIDLARNYNKTAKKNHPELFKELEEEEYILLDKKKEKNNKQKDKDNAENENKTNNKIFEYGLRYYFNIMLRLKLKEREYMNKFDEIIKAYIESDSNKAKYIIEEFSDNDALNEYLVFCPIKENVKYSMNIIITAFKKYSNDKAIEDKKLLFNFINSLLLFIYYNIGEINLEYIITLLNQLLFINKDKVFVKYLKEKNIDLWISTLSKEEMTEEDETNNDLIMGEENITRLKSDHYILTDKIRMEDPSEKKEFRRDSDFNTAYEKKLKDIDANYTLMKNLGAELNKEK